MEIPYCPLTPTPHQEQWLANRDHSYAFVSNGAGAGKSTALIMAALQDIQIPGYRGVIFYRTSTIQHWWVDQMDHWWEDDPTLRYLSQGNWLFPRGSQLCFRVLPIGGHSRRYEGTEWNFMGFEDVESYTGRDKDTESFLASHARGRGSRLRSTYCDRSAPNPLLADNPHVEHRIPDC